MLNASNAVVESSAGLGGSGIADGYDGLGIRTEQDVDPLNRLKTTIQNLGGTDTATQNATTGYVYDTRDNLRQVTDPDGLVTVYDHDGLNNLTGLHSPDTGTTTYSHDRAGNRTGQTDARGVTSTYAYDALNRLTAIGYPTTSLNVAYAYDQADATTGCTASFPKGRLTRMTDASGSTTYCYDRRGNVTKKTQVTSGATLVTQASYTTADRVQTLTYPSGGLVTSTRDSTGRVTGLTWKASAVATPVTLVGSASYLPFGPLSALTYGNGRTQTKAYDQDYAIDRISGTPAGALTLDFGVDAMGDIASASATLSPTTPDRVYQYDPLYRLTAANSGTSSPLEAYTYSKTGDRLSASLNGGTATAYAYAAGTHRLVSVGGQGRASDANGNQTTRPGNPHPLAYDDRNRLVEVKVPFLGSYNLYRYTHSGSGERVLKLISDALGDRYELATWDAGGHLLGVYPATSGGGSESRVVSTAVSANLALGDEFIYLDSTPVGLVRGGVLYYLETDHLGTPRQVVKPSTNTVVWKWDLLANTFGSSTPNADPDGDGTTFTFNLRFPGQYYDAESGLHYNYFRDYEATTGRYVESDPIGLKGGITTYIYVGGRPLITFDPKGLYGSFSEGTNCIRKYGWDACHLADSCGSAATKYSVGMRPNDLGVGDRQDALRHCFLACCMTKALGAKTTSSILFDHELFTPPPPGRECERYQDFLIMKSALALRVDRGIVATAEGLRR